MDLKQQISLPKNPMPIVLIGGGGIVADGHLPAYKMAGFQVLGVYDIDYRKARSLQSRFPQVEKVYGSLQDLILDAQKYKAVYDIAVPASNTLSILRQLPDKAPVLIQKPMGETLKEAKEILECCQRKQLVSAINFQLRYAPYTLAARDLINKGFLGDVFDLEIKVCVFTPWHLWEFLRGLPRVEILYHSIHYLDLVRSFWGNPERIYASTRKHPKTPDLSATRSSMILDYEQDRQARILTNHGHDFGLEHQESYLKMEGTKGAVKIRIGLSLDYPKGVSPKMEYIFPHDHGSWQELPLIGGWFPHAFMGTMAALQNHYLTGSPLSNSTVDAYKTMQLVEAAYRSSECGGTPFEFSSNKTS